MSVAACEINSCGVQAIGRCRGCSSAFCATHQGVTGYSHPRLTSGVKFRDQCSRCLVEAEETERKARAKLDAEAEILGKAKNLRSVAEQMAEAGCPGLTPRTVSWTTTKKVFLGSRTVTESYSGESAWPVGSHDCVGRLGMTEKVELGVTAEGMIVRMGDANGSYRERPRWAHDEDMFNLVERGISFVTRCLMRNARSHNVEIDLDLPGD